MMNQYSDQVQGQDATIGQEVRGDRLYTKLLRSHLTVAVIGVVMLAVSLATIVWLRSSAIRLANVRGPTSDASMLALGGLQRSLAGLRGWMVLGDPAFKEERVRAWDEEILPALGRLRELSEDWTEPKNTVRFASVTQILDELNRAQQRIEDVAQTPGNEPARSLFWEKVHPIDDEIFLTISNLIELEKGLPSTDRKLLLAAMADFRGMFTRAAHDLYNFVNHARDADEQEFRMHLEIAGQRLKSLEASRDLLTSEQRSLLARIKDKLSAYEPLASEVTAIRKSENWNIANHLLATEAAPRAAKSSKLLKAMSTSQRELMANEAAVVTKISNVAVFISLALILGGLFAAVFVSRRNANRITHPISVLVRATEELADGRLNDDIPVICNDELGRLTESFNAMRKSRQKAEAELARRNIALHKSDSKTQSVLATAVDGIITIDGRGSILSFNNSAETMFGYAEAEVLGRNVNCLMPSPYADEHDGYLANFLRTGERKIIGIGREVDGLRKDGSTFPMDLAVSQVGIEGEIVFAGFVRDVTERKQAESELARRNVALRKSESIKRSVLTTAVDAIITINERGSILSFNNAAETMFGYSEAEVLGRNVNGLMPSPYAEEHDGYIANFLRTGERKIIGIGREVVGLRKDGSTFPMDLAVSQVEIEGEIVFAGIVRDVSERKEAGIELGRRSAALQKSESMMRSVLTTAVDGIITIDERGSILSYNNAAETMFGYTEAEVLDRNVNCLMPSPYSEEHDGYLENFLRTGDAKIIGSGREVVGLRKDGSTFPMDLAVSQVEIEGGEIVFAGIVRDVTERNRAEAELNEQNEELIRKNRELGEFTYVASHDLQEPLRKLVSFSKLLETDIGGNLPKRAAEDLGFITDAARRMQTLVQDLLKLSRAGRSDLDKKRMDLNVCVDQAINSLAARIEETDAQITRDDLPVVFGDQTLLTQLYQNLISNALKFIPPDQRPAVRITSEVIEGEWIFGVRDNGIGMKSEYLEQVFAPFKRLHGRTEFEGTGIGLAICRKAVERHGGHIWVESEPGKGAHFKFTILGKKEARQCQIEKEDLLSSC
ncbi:MAG: PAS domain S-box protein [Phycisphaerales bacterium]|nr:PAS domain S-box protein [Phycisphaerales bacterium]